MDRNGRMRDNGKSLLDALERLAALREAGHLTEAEFDVAKRQLGLASPRNAQGAARFEYHTIEAGTRLSAGWMYIRASSETLDRIRNQMGTAGWEFTRDEGDEYKAKLVFRRPLGSSDDPPPIESALVTLPSSGHYPCPNYRFRVWW